MQKKTDSQYKLRPKGLLACSDERELIQGLIHALEEVAKPNGRAILEKPKETRKRLLSTLKVISSFIETLTDKFVENKEENINYVVKSYSSELINRLINALDELQDGIVDPILKPHHQGNRALTANDLERREIACTCYRALVNHKLSKEARLKKVASAFGVGTRDVASWLSNRRKPAGSKSRRK